MLSSPFIVLIKDRMRVENKVKEESCKSEKRILLIRYYITS